MVTVAKNVRRPLEVDFSNAGVCLLESHHHEDFRMEVTEHPFLKVLFVLSGRGRLHAPQYVSPMGPHTVALIPPRTPHRVEDLPKDPLALYVICVSRDALPRALTSETQKIEPAVITDPPYLADFRRVMRRLFYEQARPRPGSAFTTIGLTLQMVSWIVRGLPAGDTQDPVSDERTPAVLRMEQYVAELERTFYQPLTIDVEAGRLGISRRYFTRLFRELTGTTWHRHVQRLRLAHARYLMNATDRTLMSIGFECGYNDHSAFYRAFRKEMGVSPEQWRISRSPT